MIDERPDALLKSALEKIVYFEARSEQLTNDLNSARAEVERCKQDLASAAQREIELRRHVAEQEVRAQRAHSEREQMGRVVEALRAERAALIGKLIEASRISGSSRAEDEDDERFDLASFIAELRSEALEKRASPAPVPAQVAAPPRAPAVVDPSPPAYASPLQRRAHLESLKENAARASTERRSFPEPASAVAPSAPVSSLPPEVAPAAVVFAGSPAPAAALLPQPAAALLPEGETVASEQVSTSPADPLPPEPEPLPPPRAPELSRLPRMGSPSSEGRPSGQSAVAPIAPAARAAPGAAPMLPSASRRPATITVTAHAERLLAEGRLKVSEQDSAALTGRSESFRGRTEETLFGFSVRELSAPDSAARIRAAERLKALAHPAAAPALATALNAESDPQVQVALLVSFATFAHQEGVAIVAPLLTSQVPDVRITALKALIALDASQAGPHLAAAMKDPDRAVRRRASLLALGLAGPAALELGEEAIRDDEPEVRSLAALVLGASGGERARSLLLEALRDRERKVRQAAAQSLSRILGHDVSAVVSMDEAQRRREIRRLSGLPVKLVTSAAPMTAAVPVAPVAAPLAATPVDPDPPEPEPVPPAEPQPVPVPVPRPIAPRSAPEALCAAVMTEIRTAIRGRSTAELVSVTGAGSASIAEACELLCARGQAVRRGAKFFAG